MTRTFLILLAMLLLSREALANVLQNIRIHEGPDHVRVVFDTTEAVIYELSTLNAPERVVVDFVNLKPVAGLDTELVGASRERINSLRTAEEGGRYRVVLEMKSRHTPKDFTLKPIPPYGHRLVIDLFAGEGARSQVPVQPMPSGERDVIIAIDAGHGGDDPGAIAANRAYEKRVVLEIANRVATEVGNLRGFKPFLVRKGDYYVPLRDRVRIAREARADLFVSIHADAFTTASAGGASVYTLSDRGATSEMARWLADKENKSDLIGGVGEVTLNDKDPVLRSVLLDLAMDGNRSASLDAGKAVLSALGKTTRLHKHTVEQAGFAVLKAPDIPSLLVETGFLSNPAEARRLSTRDHQEKIARAITRGIQQYMENAPPPGTLLARRLAADPSRQPGTRYTIMRGDTLSHIATRFGVSREKIRQANGLKGDVIRVGQVLVIPAG
ncbi:MAG: N-acetylmuramoyl-L-alanine amidase [Pseudomonadales bacterium]|nr:N-acetylmuramoyl-L-alanine amidase [Pseudomonadales bacterium]